MNRLQTTITRANEVLENLEALKGKLYACRVNTIVNVVNMADALDCGREEKLIFIAMLMRSWELHPDNPEHKKMIDEMLADCNVLGRQTTI